MYCTHVNCLWFGRKMTLNCRKTGDLARKCRKNTSRSKRLNVSADGKGARQIESTQELAPNDPKRSKSHCNEHGSQLPSEYDGAGRASAAQRPPLCWSAIRVRGHSAVWFIDAEEIKFYDEAGAFLT